MSRSDFLRFLLLTKLVHDTIDYTIDYTIEFTNEYIDYTIDFNTNNTNVNEKIMKDLSEFTKELETLINKYSVDAYIGTNDFIIASALTDNVKNMAITMYNHSLMRAGTTTRSPVKKRGVGEDAPITTPHTHVTNDTNPDTKHDITSKVRDTSYTKAMSDEDASKLTEVFNDITGTNTIIGMSTIVDDKEEIWNSLDNNSEWKYPCKDDIDDKLNK